MGVKRSVVDLAIVLLAGFGIWLVLQSYIPLGIFLIIGAIVLSFWRTLGYKFLKWLGL